MEDAMAAGLYNGFKINNTSLSHLFFADDALFIGEWSRSNIQSLVGVLDCFHKVSGLKINYHKSKLFGYGVTFDEVSHLASTTGCNALLSPFDYLGIPINSNMALVKSWDPIIKKFSKRLSNWKASLLSIGGGATLISSVLGAIGTYYFSLFPMPNLVKDAWVWTVDTSSFLVKSARHLIDRDLHPADGPETRWNKLLPKKINIFTWRTLRDRLPSRWNLSRKGIKVTSLNCPLCDQGMDTGFHTFWTCSLASTVWVRVFNWVDLTPPSISSLKELFSWIDGLHMPQSKRLIVDVICGTALWSLWRFRNETIFGPDPPKRSLLFDNIVDFSFKWYSSRCKLHSISWNNWIQNPLVVLSL
nr:reverse transcriptase domain, reverse transcriptase zinc-binding domain protein [Tanacetum cinerariifolium]